MRPPANKRVRILFVLLMLPVWALFLFLTLEAGCRSCHFFAEFLASNIYGSQADQARMADDLVFQQVRKSSPPPDTVPWNLPARARILELNEAGRGELARQRREIILECDRDGKILHIYPCDATPEMAEISARIKVGDSLGTVLPAEELADALRSLRQAGEQASPIREYEVALANNAEYSMEFYAIRLPSDAPRFAVFLSPSRYLRRFREYRPRVYQRNWYQAQFNDSEFWTNALGFRDREIELPKPSDRVRIICIGGSTTVEGPHNDLTYPKFLERMLRERLGTDRIEVINCGVDAVGFVTERERIPDWLALEPDLVLHYNMVNDTVPILDVAARMAGLRESKWRAFWARSALVNTAAPHWFFPSDRHLQAAAEQHVYYFARDMADAFRDHGVDFAMCSFAAPVAPHISCLEAVYFRDTFGIYLLTRLSTRQFADIVAAYNHTIRAFCEKEGLMYIPVAEQLSGGARLFADVCHMRLPGIERKAAIMAEALADYVRTRLEAKDASIPVEAEAIP